MFIHPVILEKKGRISWVVGNNGSSVVINPFRDVEVYFNIANERSLPIKYCFLTHIDDEIVLGCSELAHRGIRVFVPADWDIQYPHIVPDIPVKWEGFFIKRASLPVSVYEEEGLWEWFLGEEIKIIVSGPTISIGGIPEIASSSTTALKKKLAAVFGKLNELTQRYSPDTIVLPTAFHSSVLEGEFKLPYKFEYWIDDIKDVRDFAETDPWYFYKPESGWHKIRREKNRIELPTMEEVISPLKTVLEEIPDNAVVLDIRSVEEIEYGFIPQANYLPVNLLEEYAEKLVPPGAPVVLVGNESEAISVGIRLARLGIDKFLGRIDFMKWRETHEFDMIIPITGEELELDFQTDDSFFLIDVRPEHIVNETGIISSAENIPFEGLLALDYRFKEGDKVYVYGRDGGEAIMGAMILKRKGAPIVRAVITPFEDLLDLDLPTYRIINLK